MSVPAFVPPAERDLRVLIVDDDDVDRMIVRRALDRGFEGAQVTESSGEGDVIALIRDGGYDCVFLDYNLPGTSGLAVLRSLRAAGCTSAVIALTGQGDEEVAVELMKAGATEYIPKSALTPERLTRGVRYAVELSRAAAATKAAQTELRDAAESTRFLAEASRAMAVSLDVESTMRTVASLCVPRLGDLCFIFTTLGDVPRRVAAAHADARFEPLLHEFERLYPRARSSWSLVQAAIDTRLSQRRNAIDSAFVRELGSDDEQRRLFERLHHRSAIAVPLIARDAVVGAIAFGRIEDVPYTDRELALAEDVAQRAATAMDNAHLFALMSDAKRRAEEAAGRTERLQQLTAALVGTVSASEVGDLLMRHGVLSMGAYAGVIAEPTADGEELELFTCVGYPEAACMSRGRRWPMAANIPLAESARSGKAVLVESPEAWKERYPAAYAPAAPNTSVAPVSSSRAWAAFPMHGESGVRGSMLWTFDHPRTFSDEDRRFMEAVAQQGAQALERARLREAEERARAEAEEANRAKSDFLARMSHDLRTPLNAIGGYAELMEEGIYGEPTAGQRQSIERIRRAQQHLLTLINDVLSFAKLEAGQVSVSVRRVPMTEILTELRALIEPQVAAKGLQLELSGDASDLVLLVDPDRVVQILGNLLTNAVKFTDAGGHLTLSWERVDDDVEIAVRDTGRGIPAERLRAIFDPFVQIDGPEHGARQGVGLGLAIGRELARMLKGDLRVESRVGEGSTFTLRLPLERSARPEPAEMQAAL